MFLFVSVGPLFIFQTLCFCGKSSLWPLQEGYSDFKREYAEVADEWEKNYVELNPFREVICDYVIKCTEVNFSSSFHTWLPCCPILSVCAYREQTIAVKNWRYRRVQCENKGVGSGHVTNWGKSRWQAWAETRSNIQALLCLVTQLCLTVCEAVRHTWCRLHEADNQSLRISQSFKVKAVNW